MQCFTELTPPTAVTHSLTLPFLSSSANNLVVAKTSLLQIFSFKSVLTITNDKTVLIDAPIVNHNQRVIANAPESSSSNSATAKDNRLYTTKLVLVAQYELSGTIISLARVKILRSKSGGEALLVALRDAKLSLIEWDPERYSISTISIHFYEREDILSSPWEPDLASCVNYLSVDPSSRCAALKFGARHLAILPFHQVGDDLVLDDYDPDIDGEQPEKKQSISKHVDDDKTIEKTPYASSFVLSLLALDPALSHPLHLSFLYEYREPTFGVLFSQMASSSAMLHERRDNISYSVYTLDLEQRASTTLLSISNLPYDLFAVIPLSRLVGGALLVGANEVIHVDQSGKMNGVAVNEFAKQSTNFGLLDQSDLSMRLENCEVKQLSSDNSDILIILGTGELAVLSFKIDGRSVSGLSVRRVSAGNGGNALLAGPSCASIIGRGRLFIGSEESDSLVLGWSRKSDRFRRQRSRTHLDIDNDQAEVELDEEDAEEDEDDLYADSRPEERAHEQAPSVSNNDKGEDYSFRIHDSMLNLGPITDTALRTLPQTPSTVPSSQELSSKAEILATSGRGRAGAITTLQHGIAPILTDQYNIYNVQRVWSIFTKPTQEDGAGPASQLKYDKYIIASTITETGEEKSAAYCIRETGLEEVKDTDFDPNAGATTDVGTLNGGTRMVQVLQAELRTYDGGEHMFNFNPFKYKCSIFIVQWVIIRCFMRQFVHLNGLDEAKAGSFRQAEGRAQLSEPMSVYSHLYSPRQQCLIASI